VSTSLRIFRHFPSIFGFLIVSKPRETASSHDTIHCICDTHRRRLFGGPGGHAVWHWLEARNTSCCNYRSLPVQRGSYTVEQYLVIKRFSQELHCSCPHSLYPHFFVTLSRNENDRNSVLTII